MGILSFEFLGDPIILEVHVFQSKIFSGEVRESDGKIGLNQNLIIDLSILYE